MLWLSTISQHKGTISSLLHHYYIIITSLYSCAFTVRDSYCSYSVMDTCLRELANSASTLKVFGIY